MKHAGKARKAAFKLVLLTLIAGLIFWALIALASLIGTILSALVIPVAGLAIWLLFAIFTLYFFRDPTPRVPAGANLVVSPAHGKIDVVDTITEPQFMGGSASGSRCSCPCSTCTCSTRR